MKRPAPDQFPPMPAVTLTDDVDGMCAPCVEGDHEDCAGWSAETGGCMCIDMDHDEDED